MVTLMEVPAGIVVAADRTNGVVKRKTTRTAIFLEYAFISVTSEKMGY